MKLNSLITIAIIFCLLACNQTSKKSNEAGKTPKLDSVETKENLSQQTKVVSEFDYLDNNRTRQHAKLSPAHFPSTPLTQSGTNDPMWYGNNPANGTSGGPWEYLTYLGTDGGCWKTRIHAEYDGGSHTIKIEIESKNCNDDGSNGTFQIVDWDGVKWNMTIQSRVMNDKAPVFTMTRL